MSDQSRVDELLERWEEAREMGKSLSPEQLCQDTPHLLEHLRERIKWLAALQDVFDAAKPSTESFDRVVDERDADPASSARGTPDADGDRDRGDGDTSAFARSTRSTRPRHPNHAHETPEAHPATPQDAPPPERIGRYRIVRVLGQGGFGQVLLGRDDDLDRQVAIKIPRPDRVLAREEVESYLEEARTAAKLDHPAIVPVYDVGRTDENRPFVVSKYLPGLNLAERLAAASLTYREAAEIVARTAEALHHAHLHGVIHRDVKPGNILLDGRGLPHVADFGLALRHEQFALPPGLAGTPAYMSPEQASGEGHLVDGRSDIFSLGVVLYELLTGRRPFRASSLPDLLQLIRRAAAWPPRQVDDGIPRELERICLRALARLPADRYTTAGDMANELREWLQEGQAAAGAPRDRAEPSTSRGTGTNVAIHEPAFMAWDFRPTLVEKRRDFCGRRWLLQDLDGWRQSDAFERAMLIVGPPGCGKSAFLAMCADIESDRSILASYFCQAETPATLHPGQFVQNLTAGFAQALPEYREQLALDETAVAALAPAQCKADPVTALEVGLLGPLARLKDVPRSPGLVLLDALDECLLHESGMTILELLAPRLERFPHWVRIVATTREEPRVMERLGGVRLLQLTGDDTRNQADVRDYIRRRLEGAELSARLTDCRLSVEVATARLEERAEGNFLFARHALDGLERRLYSFDRLHELPPSLHGLYSAYFERRYPRREDFRRVRALLEVLLAAAEPLSEEQLAEAASIHLDEELPSLLEDLAPFLAVYEDAEGERRYKPFHKSIVDWLTDRRRRSRIHWANLSAGHSRLADFCHQRFASGEPYCLSHCVKHLLAARRHDDLESLLTDYSFWRARIEREAIFDFVRDLQRAVSDLPAERPMRRIIQCLQEALCRDLHLIAHHPDSLFQCLWNSAAWSDATETSAHYEGASPVATSAPGTASLRRILERWRAERRTRGPLPWLRSQRPPTRPLGRGLLLVMRGHEDEVTAVTFSQDGRRVISGSADGTIRVWDAAIGEELQRLDRDMSGIAAFDLSPDGESLVAADRTGALRIFDLRTGREKVRDRLNSAICDVRFSPDGRSIACALWDACAIRICDAETLAEQRNLAGHTQAVLGAAWDPSGKWLLSHSRDQTVRMWPMDDTVNSVAKEQDAVDSRGTARSTSEIVLYLPGSWIRCLALSEDGTRVAAGSTAGRLHLLDLISRREQWRADIQGGDVTAVAIQGDQVCAASNDRTMRTFAIGSGRMRSTFMNHEAGTVTGVDLSPRGDKLVSGSFDGSVCLWDTSRPAPQVERLRGHSGFVQSLAFTADGKWLVSGGADNAVLVWDAETGLPVRRIDGHQRPVLSVVVSPDGRLLATGSSDSSIRLWDFDSGRLLHRFRSAALGYTRHLRFLGDSETVAYVEYDHSGAWLRAHFWNSVSGRKVAELSQRDVAVFSEVVTTGATLIAVGRRDGILELRDGSSGRTVLRKRAHDSRIVAIDVAPNRSRLATVAEDASIHVFCPESRDTFVFRDDDHRVADLALSPDSRSLATVSEEGTLCLWDVSTGARRTSIRHREALTGVEFTPDGAYLLTASRLNKVVRIHDARSLDVRTTIDIRKHDRFPAAQDFVVVTNEQEIVDQVWSHALLHALSRDAFYGFSDAGQFVVVDTLNGTPVARFPTALRGLAVHPNGRRWAGTRAADVYLLELETEG